MKRIPYGGQSDGVAGNLVVTTEGETAQLGRSPTVTPARFPLTLRELWQSRHFLDFRSSGISMAEMAYFVERLFLLQASCEDRRYQEWEYKSWWDFCGAAQRSAGYKKFLADGVTRKLVAAQAREASARTIGYIALQILQTLTTPGAPMDRLLNGPTSAVWIDPWLDHLRRRGVRYRTQSKVVAIECQAGRVSSVTIRQEDDEHKGNEYKVTADYYVAAVPVEVMKCLVEATPALAEADPRLGELRNLRTRWMNGIQFYLKHDVPLAHGHTIYADSPFALTSISQHQFWPTTPLTAMGSGSCQGVLSVDISDWETPGPRFGKPAMQLTPNEVKDEVWDQLKAHLNVRGKVVLDDQNLLGWFLDPDIVPPNPRRPGRRPGRGRLNDVNLEPLLVNTCGSWYLRPKACTMIGNLFLASDYVQTFTDLATMEGANEAARRAVNGILDASGSKACRCAVWPPREPVAFAPLRELDALRFRRRVDLEPCRTDGSQAVQTSNDCKQLMDDWTSSGGGSRAKAGASSGGSGVGHDEG
jgi:uncharacterized protein with NAD-binding domain and iron-sulfur cluster